MLHQWNSQLHCSWLRRMNMTSIYTVCWSDLLMSSWLSMQTSAHSGWVFMGLLLSKNGIGPTEEKVKAVVEVNQPQTLSQVFWDSGIFHTVIPRFLQGCWPCKETSKERRAIICGEKQKLFEKLKVKLQVHQYQHTLTRTHSP